MVILQRKDTRILKGKRECPTIIASDIDCPFKGDEDNYPECGCNDGREVEIYLAYRKKQGVCTLPNVVEVATAVRWRSGKIIIGAMVTDGGFYLYFRPYLFLKRGEEVWRRLSKKRFDTLEDARLYVTKKSDYIVHWEAKPT